MHAASDHPHPSRKYSDKEPSFEGILAVDPLNLFAKAKADPVHAPNWKTAVKT